MGVLASLRAVYQVIPGNDLNAIPANHGTTRSKLDRTS